MLNDFKNESVFHLQLRQKMYDEAREKERMDQNAQRAEEARRQIIIEEERRRLLQEYAMPMRDFLPKGTLERQEDHDMIFTKRTPRYATQDTPRSTAQLTARSIVSS